MSYFETFDEYIKAKQESKCRNIEEQETYIMQIYCNFRRGMWARNSDPWYCLGTENVAAPYYGLSPEMEAMYNILEQVYSEIIKSFEPYTPIGKLVCEYAGAWINLSNSKGSAMIVASKLKNYELWINSTINVHDPSCHMYYELGCSGKDCPRCEKFRNCRWKFTPLGGFCACGWNIYRVIFEHNKSAWINRNPAHRWGHVAPI